MLLLAKKRKNIYINRCVAAERVRRAETLIDNWLAFYQNCGWCVTGKQFELMSFRSMFCFYFLQSCVAVSM